MFSEANVCAADFMDRYIEVCRIANPFMRFGATALGVPW